MMGHYTIRACYTPSYPGASIKAFQTDPGCRSLPWGDLSCLQVAGRSVDRPPDVTCCLNFRSIGHHPDQNTFIPGSHTHGYCSLGRQ